MKSKLIKFFKSFFILTGFLAIFSLLVIMFFGETSKQRRDTLIGTVSSFIGVGEKYETFIANSPQKYFKIFYYNIKNKFIEYPYYSLNIDISSSNLNKLSQLRENKVNKKISKFENVSAKIEILNEKKNSEKEIVRVRIRPKGDREIHFLNFDTMSYKIDVRKDESLIFGMEEMSLQRPIIRNYSWEILYHDLLKLENVLALDIIPVKLSRNNEYLGIFVLEEGFGKELLEKQLRRNGPIYGIDENLNHGFPGLKYEVYSANFWLKNENEIYYNSQKNLNYVKQNYNKKDFNLSEYFDLDKWAKFFAITDVLRMYHGAVSKSVKIYYNPQTELFEPVAFDGHHGSGYLNFSFTDFIYDPNIDCGFLCTHKDWLSVFFDKKNKDFLNKFMKYLKLYTSKDYEDKISNILDEKINLINSFFYSEYHSSDRVFFKGMLPYYFDIEPIFERNIILKKKIDFTEKYLEGYYSQNQL